MKIVYQLIDNLSKILLSRRRFLLFFPLFIATCKREETEQFQTMRKVILGHKSKFSQGQNPLPLERLLVLREAEKFSVLSLVCTHQYCLLKVSASALVCPCHAASFDFQGRVLTGPAERALAHYRLELDGDGVLSADLNQEVDADWRLSTETI